jgi:segregation and condensation protein B
MMKQEQLKNIIEAALMASEYPLNINSLIAMFEKDEEQPERSDIKECIDRLQQDYSDRAVELREVASGYRFQIRPDYAEWVNRIYDDRPQRYSRAMLETLAIIAYRQPVTRGEIEDIRGVSVSSNIIKTLQERGWLRIVGHRDVPGKPALLATTREFLDYFNLKKLSDLPSLEEIKDFDQINPDLFESLQAELEPALPQQDISAPENAVEPEFESTAAEPAPEAVLEPEQRENTESDDHDNETGDATEKPDDNVVPFAG